jgi:hypothetical protein
VDKLSIEVMSHTSDETTSKSNLIAIGLLRLQQRLEELDRLYNEEVSNLAQELAQLQADYVPLYLTRSSLPRAAKSSRGRTNRAQDRS